MHVDQDVSHLVSRERKERKMHVKVPIDGRLDQAVNVGFGREL